MMETHTSEWVSCIGQAAEADARRLRELLAEARVRLDQYRNDCPVTEDEFVGQVDPLSMLIKRIDVALGQKRTP